MYLNVTGSQPAAGLSGPRYVALPTIITPRAVVRGMGVLMLRGMGAKVKIPPPTNFPFRRAPGFGRYRGLRGFRGLGVSYDQAYNILAQDTLSAVNNGSFSSGAAFQAGVGADVMGICSQLAAFDQVNGKDEACPPDMQQQIAAAAASYDAWLKGQAYQPPPSFANSSYGQVPDVYYFNAPPGYQKNIYTGQLEPIPGWPQSVSGYATAANTTVGQQVTQQQQQQQSQPAGQSLGVRIENLTSGSTSSFKVGDSWRLTITGPANSPVTGSSVHNGQSNAAAPFGNTNASGVAVLTGTMAADTVGNWSEQWFVGGQSAGSISFTVTAPAAATSTGSGSGSGAGQQQQQQQTNTGGGSGSTGQQQQQQTNAGGGAAPSFDLSTLTSSLSNQTSIAGFSLPLWGWVAIAGVGLYAVTRGKK